MNDAAGGDVVGAFLFLRFFFSGDALSLPSDAYQPASLLQPVLVRLLLVVRSYCRPWKPLLVVVVLVWQLVAFTALCLRKPIWVSSSQTVTGGKRGAGAGSIGASPLLARLFFARSLARRCFALSALALRTIRATALNQNGYGHRTRVRASRLGSDQIRMLRREERRGVELLRASRRTPTCQDAVPASRNRFYDKI